MSISIIKGLSATGELVSLRLNDDGSLPITGGGGSSSGSGGDSSAANQLVEIQRLEQIRDRLPTDGAKETSQLVEIQRLEQIRDRLPASGAATEANQLIEVQRLEQIRDRILTDGAREANQLIEIQRLEQVRDRLPLDGAAREATLDSIRANLPSASTPVLTRSLARKWRDDFSGTALSSDWQLVQQGAGQTITVTSSELRITAGTNANAETIIRSTKTSSIAFRAIFIASLSQRIANQEIYFEIVDASGQHRAAWRFDGTSAGFANILATNGGTGLTASGVQTISNTLIAYELEATPDEVNFYTRTPDSSNSRASSSGVRSRQIPDPNLEYYLQIRVKNLATAPASNTTITIDAVLLQDIEELTAEVVGGRGGGGANQSIPVAITGTPSINSSITSSTTTSSLETTTAIGANATFTGSVSTRTGLSYCRGFVFTDQPGTLLIDFGRDANAANLRNIRQINCSTGGTPFDMPLYSPFIRFRYTNGATAQTVLEIVVLYSYF